MENMQTYLDTAETKLIELLKSWRPKLLESHGQAAFDLKADRSVVTQLDGELELAIKNTLRPIKDDIGFLGEEHGQEGSAESFWLVDPIDGTEQYIRGMNSCRTLVCLIVNDEPAYMLAYRFTTDDMFTARKGLGAFKNSQPIKLIPRPLERAWIETSYDMQNPEIVQKIKQIHHDAGSVVYTHEFLNVVEGFLDGYIVYSAKGKVWDYAPRALLMQEAGLKVTNIGSEAYDYKNLSLLAAHPDVHASLQTLLSPQA